MAALRRLSGRQASLASMDKDAGGSTGNRVSRSKCTPKGVLMSNSYPPCWPTALRGRGAHCGFWAGHAGGPLAWVAMPTGPPPLPLWSRWTEVRVLQEEADWHPGTQSSGPGSRQSPENYAGPRKLPQFYLNIKINP